MIADIRESTGHGIRPICAALGVPRSSYYHAAEPTFMQRSDQEIGVVIERIFKLHRRRYGYRRIWEELGDEGIICAPAWTESFIGTLKIEMLQDGCFISAADARTEIFAYIESYYNTQREHSSLGYLTPAQFEATTLSLN